jgi:uncharacterized protein
VQNLDLSLIEAIKNNDTTKVIQLLEKGANPNFCDKYIHCGYIDSSRNPLHLAVRCSDDRGFGLDFFDNPEIVKALVKFGAEINKKDSNEFTPLRWASVEPKIESAKVLLEKGADVNLTDFQGSSPLMIASLGRNQNFIEMLLNNGANINHQNNFGDTPLMYSLNFVHIEGQIDTLKLLLKNGADSNLKNKKGDTLMYLLSHRKENPKAQEAIDLLIKYGFKE